MPTSKKRLPKGLEIQSLAFDNRKFTPSQARSWAASHGFRAPATDQTENRIRLRQRAPGSFSKETFRTVTLAPGVQAIVARPKPGSVSTSKGSSKKKSGSGVKKRLSKWFLKPKKRSRKRRK